MRIKGSRKEITKKKKKKKETKYNGLWDNIVLNC